MPCSRANASAESCFRAPTATVSHSGRSARFWTNAVAILPVAMIPQRTGRSAGSGSAREGPGGTSRVGRSVGSVVMGSFSPAEKRRAQMPQVNYTVVVLAYDETAIHATVTGAVIMDAANALNAGQNADPTSELSDRDCAILNFERHWWKYAGAKEQAVREKFDMSSTRYYQVLNTLIDRPEALAFDPLLVRRLRRLRAARQRARSARRLGFDL